MFGNRVVRGPDWSRKEDEDGGEGGVGTILRSEESLNDVDQIVVVCWDTGLEDLYRTGPDGYCDLRVLDSAPSGVTSKNFWCDGCGNQTDIAGMRWHCVECAELSYDLCSLCYHGDKHDTSHNFIRFDSPSHPGTSVGMRSAVARVQARGIYPGALVQCGRDWDQGPECDGSDGIVLELTTREDTARSSALVQWGDIEEYHRIGYDGKVDLKLKDCDSAQGPLYYREHLPTAISPIKADMAQTDLPIEASAAEQPTQKLTKDVSSVVHATVKEVSKLFKNYNFQESKKEAVEFVDMTKAKFKSKMQPLAVKLLENLIGDESRMIQERRDSSPDLEVQSEDNEEQELEGAVANMSLARQPDEDDNEEDIQEIVCYFGALEKLKTIDANEIVNRLPVFLNVDMYRTTVVDPPKNVMEKCRCFCRKLKEYGRREVVERLRYVLPNGMTGPLRDGGESILNIEYLTKLKLTRALSVKDEWKIMAENIGLSSVDIEFYAQKETNHAMAVLDGHCSHLTVDQLYSLLVRSGANAIADYL